MRYALAVYGAFSTSQSAWSALRFAEALIASGHTIARIFFYRDGVHNASSIVQPPQDETNMPEMWRKFVEQNDLDGVVCIAAALRRGIVNETEQKRYSLQASNLGGGWALSGLGQLIESVVEADRLVTFGE